MQLSGHTVRVSGDAGPEGGVLVQGKIQFKDVSTLDARVCRFVAICVTSLLIWHNRGYVFLAEPNYKRLSKEICS